MRPHAALALALGLAACRHEELPRVPDGFTVADTTRDAFSLPFPALSNEERKQFFLGNSFFNQNWVTAPASTADRDGLGPLFNARSCSTCHFKDGRGSAPDAAGEMQTMLLRISVMGRDAHGAPLPDPTYGDQIQNQAIAGAAPEARVIVDYVEHTGSYADGEPYALREPRVRLADLAYGPTAQELQVSGRIAPALIGLGLLGAVPDADLLARADPDDRDRDGISGRANRVWRSAGPSLQLGRFGWKAEQPDVRQQIAAAFLADMGITSTLFPDESCTRGQAGCAALPSGGRPEIEDSTLESVVRYVNTLAVPAQRPLARELAERGERLFRSARCSACHVDTLRTGPVAHARAISGATIHPYTDLLLHDLGPGLADHRPAFLATGREFRTAPLWGLGLVQKVNGQRTLLHDGRARDVAEATLWHGGEAEASKLAFVAMPRPDRAALIAFVESR
ncbi:MAG TPA: di-heme oxidoredictase family protein [Polyangiales bacterium]|nr:di-heme oxidoredictase family protein [Polyangiales bacterium]